MTERVVSTAAESLATWAASVDPTALTAFSQCSAAA